MIQAHLRNCHGVIVCVDSAREKSVEGLEEWVKRVRDVASDSCQVTVVARKIAAS